VSDIVSELSRGNYVSMAMLFVMHQHKGKPFADVVRVFGDRVTSPDLVPSDVSGIVAYVTQVRFDAIHHAARIIVSRQGPNVTALTTLVKQDLRPELVHCAASMCDLVPCCAVNQGEGSTHKVCGQPCKSHDRHKTIHKQGWFHARGESWSGDYRPAIGEAGDPNFIWGSTFAEEVFCAADSLLKTLHSLPRPPLHPPQGRLTKLTKLKTSPLTPSMGSKDEGSGGAVPMASVMRQLIPAPYWNEHLAHLRAQYQGSTELKTVEKCFICICHLPRHETLSGWFKRLSASVWRPEYFNRIDVCKECEAGAKGIALMQARLLI